MTTTYPTCSRCQGGGSSWLKGLDPKRPDASWTVRFVAPDLDGELRCIRCCDREDKAEHERLAKEMKKARKGKSKQREKLHGLSHEIAHSDEPFID